MPTTWAIDEYAFGTRTPEGVHRVVSEENLTWIQEVSNNEKYRVKFILAETPTEDALAIRELYGIK